MQRFNSVLLHDGFIDDHGMVRCGARHSNEYADVIIGVLLLTFRAFRHFNSGPTCRIL